MTVEERQMIIDAILEILLQEDHQYLGSVYENPSPSEPGIWVEINRSRAFFGMTVQAAVFTAEQMDWWYPLRDGKLLKDDYEWFELRPTLGDNWKASEPRLMKTESRTRVALNIQMETGVPEHEPDYLALQVSHPQNSERDIDYWEDDPLTQIEFLRVKGWEGLWILDKNKTTFIKIRLSGTREGYRVLMGEFREHKPGREYMTVARLTCDEEDHIVKLEFLGRNPDSPEVVLEQTDDGQIQVKNIELG